MVKTILVTGGNGFIGKNIVEYFRNSATIIAPTHAQLDLLSQEQVSQLFKDREIDYVIHCANVGGTRKHPGVDVVEKNVKMFTNLADNARYFDKMIHFGSGAEYDKRRPLQEVPETEFGKHIPVDDYGLSKYKISKLIENYENITCLRLFGVFGKYEDYEYKFISNAIVKNLYQLPINIIQNVYFSWLDINDLIKIISSFLDRQPTHKVYNVTPNVRTDLISITELINACSSTTSEIIVDNKGLNNEYSGNNIRLIDYLGQFTFTTFPQSITELIHYYQTIATTIDLDTIKKDTYTQKCVTVSGNTTQTG